MQQIPVEFAHDRRIRTRNKAYYRVNHWPIWIFVFFIAPGPLTFDLFERGFDTRMALWLGTVLIGTGIAGNQHQSSAPATSKSAPGTGASKSTLETGRSCPASLTR